MHDGIATVTGPEGEGEHAMAATLAESVAGVTGVTVR